MSEKCVLNNTEQLGDMGSSKNPTSPVSQLIKLLSSAPKLESLRLHVRRLQILGTASIHLTRLFEKVSCPNHIFWTQWRRNWSRFLRFFLWTPFRNPQALNSHKYPTLPKRNATRNRQGSRNRWLGRISYWNSARRMLGFRCVISCSSAEAEKRKVVRMC